jgi:hypothetical protein
MTEAQSTNSIGSATPENVPAGSGEYCRVRPRWQRVRLCLVNFGDHIRVVEFGASATTAT